MDELEYSDDEENEINHSNKDFFEQEYDDSEDELSKEISQALADEISQAMQDELSNQISQSISDLISQELQAELDAEIDKAYSQSLEEEEEEEEEVLFHEYHLDQMVNVGNELISTESETETNAPNTLQTDMLNVTAVVAVLASMGLFFARR